jgi:hypothetical protein
MQDAGYEIFVSLKLRKDALNVELRSFQGIIEQKFEDWMFVLESEFWGIIILLRVKMNLYCKST